MRPLRVFIGYDQREAAAYRVAEASLRKHASMPVSITPLEVDRLAASGILRRATDRRGQIYDLHSNASASTDFHVSRFLVPHLAQSGSALFVDCDVVFMADVAELFALADPSKAVMVVKHDQFGGGTKMDGCAQLTYPRKGWSSVVLWNCDHQANRRLSLQDVNERPGRDLHAFFWLNDCEIGSLAPDWNWLVGVGGKPAQPKLAHFTMGTPNLSPELANCEHSEIWWNAEKESR